MKKRILSLALVVIMIAIMLSSFTMAYFTDAEQKTNVLTVGNISINLDERMKTDEGMVPFVDNAVPMFPLSNDDGNVSYNKVVDVYNDGKNEAYIRTIVAIESWTLPGYENEVEGEETFVKVIHNSYSSDVVETKLNPVKINGKKYIVLVYDQASTDPIQPGAKVQSLQSLWFDETVTQEMVAALNGDLDVLVLAQGVQAEGFADYEEAMEKTFGEVTSDNLTKWFGETKQATING